MWETSLIKLFALTREVFLINVLSGLQMDASDLLGSFHHPVQCFCFFFSFFFKAVQLLYYTEMQLVRILLLEQQQRSISILGDR